MGHELKGELLDSGAGWRCRECGFTVFGDAESEQGKRRLCSACQHEANRRQGVRS